MEPNLLPSLELGFSGLGTKPTVQYVSSFSELIRRRENKLTYTIVGMALTLVKALLLQLLQRDVKIPLNQPSLWGSVAHRGRGEKSQQRLKRLRVLKAGPQLGIHRLLFFQYFFLGVVVV